MAGSIQKLIVYYLLIPSFECSSYPAGDGPPVVDECEVDFTRKCLPISEGFVSGHKLGCLKLPLKHIVFMVPERLASTKLAIFIS